MPESHVLYEAVDGVAVLTLNHPEKRNALSREMLSSLKEHLDRIASDASVRAVIVRANGPVFSAGHDLRELAVDDPEAHARVFAACAQMMLAIHRLPVPVIARVQGLATAAGCQLVAQCDLAVASTDASFGVNGIDVGLFCATPSVPLVRNVPAKQAMEMLLTGEFITADQARERGLVNRVALPGQLDQEVDRLVASILGKPRVAIAMGKALFYRQREMGSEAAYQLAGQTMACNMVHEAAQEGVQAFIDKRKPQWPV